MFSESLVRKVLVLTVVYNLCGALMFMFPATLGAVADLPTPAPLINSWLVGGVILLLGMVAVWQCRRPLDLPLLTVFGIAKLAFFLLMLTSHLLGEVNLFAVLAASADLVMGTLFLGHVWQTARPR